LIISNDYHENPPLHGGISWTTSDIQLLAKVDRIVNNAVVDSGVSTRHRPGELVQSLGTEK
jgi:hypothetical protein